MVENDYSKLSNNHKEWNSQPREIENNCQKETQSIPKTQHDHKKCKTTAIYSKIKLLMNIKNDVKQSHGDGEKMPSPDKQK